MRSKTASRTGLALGFVVLATLMPGARADLVYENINGASLIYDTVTSTTWTQNGDISGQLFATQQDAANWAASLTVAGLPDAVWTLPTGLQFTSLYTQLDPVGPPGMTSDKYGSSVYFGVGMNDYASNVEPTYWTNASGSVFNFYYGYSGAPFPANSPESAWAVLVPEPSSLVLAICGFAGLGVAQLRRKKVGLRRLTLRRD